MFNLITFAQPLSQIWNILLAFLVLMFMITIHELGHYTAGKLLKFKINEFSVGMGPKIASKQTKSGEVVSLRLVPLGGYCAFEGETEDGETEHSFNRQKPWKRIIVLFAGAFFNFVSAILIAVLLFSCFGNTVMVVDHTYEYTVSENRVLQSGDIIYKVDGKEVYLAGNFSNYIKNDVFDLTVIRDGQEVELKGLKRATYTLTSVASVNKNIVSNGRRLAVGDTLYKVNGILICGEGALKNALQQADEDLTLEVHTADGSAVIYSITKEDFESSVAYVENSYKSVGFFGRYEWMKYSFADSLARTFPYCFDVAWTVLSTFGGLITGAVGLADVGGPITTITIITEVASSGFANLLSLIVMFSVNLAVFNLLPVPALDGCQIIFVIIEAIRKKPIDRKVQALVNGIGLALLFAFVITIDLLKF